MHTLSSYRQCLLPSSLEKSSQEFPQIHQSLPCQPQTPTQEPGACSRLLASQAKTASDPLPCQAVGGGSGRAILGEKSERTDASVPSLRFFFHPPTHLLSPIILPHHLHDHQPLVTLLRLWFLCLQRKPDLLSFVTSSPFVDHLRCQPLIYYLCIWLCCLA